mmetsp:Transcript_2074/g.3178  ORF Transcript_2074/g.3178 Transcript_2074/m.3178 type:complete len:146 (+) Transcript_2074:110-547(+)
MDKRSINQLHPQEQSPSKKRRLGGPTQDEDLLANALLNLCKGGNDTKSELTSRLLETTITHNPFAANALEESDSDDSNVSHNNLRLVHHVAGIDLSVTSEHGSHTLLPVCESLPIGKPLSAAPRLPSFIFIKDIHPFFSSAKAFI